MCIHGGYKTQTVVQLANLIGAYDADEISLGALRVYFGALVSVAAREAAKRSRTKVRGRGGESPRFLIEELCRTTRLPLKGVKRALRALKKVGLLNFTSSAVTVGSVHCENASDGVLALSGKRSANRPVPLPRVLLRYLARSSKASLVKTALAYTVRGVTISRTGEISGKGSVKATSIARAMRLSERSVRSARAELLQLGFITDDECSYQRKLNRCGAFFTVNLSWRGVREAIKTSPTATIPAHKFAPPGAQTGVIFAPPYKDKKTLFRSKNQRTHPKPLSPSGPCTGKIEDPKRVLQRALPPPSIRNVRAEDLKSFGRVEELYRQAVKLQLIVPTEANAINFIASAARARELANSGRVGDGPRVFIGIVRRGLWHHITQADEDLALSALRRYRADNPDRFRVAGPSNLA